MPSSRRRIYGFADLLVFVSCRFWCAVQNYFHVAAWHASAGGAGRYSHHVAAHSQAVSSALDQKLGVLRVYCACLVHMEHRYHAISRVPCFLRVYDNGCAFGASAGSINGTVTSASLVGRLKKGNVQLLSAYNHFGGQAVPQRLI